MTDESDIEDSFYLERSVPGFPAYYSYLARDAREYVSPRIELNQYAGKTMTITLRAENIEMTVAFDKASYLPGHPIGLLVRMSNPNDNEVALFWADKWPPPPRPGPVREVGFGYLVYETRIDVADNSGRQV